MFSNIWIYLIKKSNFFHLISPFAVESRWPARYFPHLTGSLWQCGNPGRASESRAHWGNTVEVLEGEEEGGSLRWTQRWESFPSDYHEGNAGDWEKEIKLHGFHEQHGSALLLVWRSTWAVSGLAIALHINVVGEQQNHARPAGSMWSRQWCLSGKVKNDSWC